jgi:FkbM family methyltransferase
LRYLEDSVGAIFFSIDLELVRRLQGALPLRVFVETGTFQGDTAELVAPHFERIYTIELSEALHARASARLQKLPNVACLQGDSSATLRKIRALHAGKGVLYWLDAHWCGPETAGQANECPLLTELDAIGPLDAHSAVLIDDARLFLAPPPRPHDASHWPSIDAVVESLRAIGQRHQLWVINDVMIFAPRPASATIVEYGQSRGLDLHTLVQEVARWRAGRAAAVARTPEPPGQAPPPPSVPAEGGSLAAGFNSTLLGVPRAELLFAHHLKRLGIVRVLDIGANSGQFAAKLRSCGYSGVIYSVEPQAVAYAELVAQTRQDPRWVALARQGAGAAAAMLDLNIAENGWSSSLREVHSNHLRAEPATRTVARERVYINRSAELLRPEVLDSIEALKIDVQGYEDQVLEGYASHLARVRLLLLELSLVECYRDSPDLFALDELLVKRHGFKRVSLEPSYYDEHTGTVQQYDGIYYRPEPAPAASLPLDGVRIGAVVTSIGGVFSRPRPDGGDFGPKWLSMCMESWRKVCPQVISAAESPPPEGVIWTRTEGRPSIVDMLSAAPLEPGQHLLLTNADIAFTDDFIRLLPTLDGAAVYYGHRLDVELDASNPSAFKSRGVYAWGFDYFLLPHSFLNVLRDEPLMPREFRVGEPWWDLALPLLALALGFPLKRLFAATPLAVHYQHPPRYSAERWFANGARFTDLLQQLLGRTPNSAMGFLTDLVVIGGDTEARLNKVSQVVVQLLP